jgi:hypothetical protein
VHSAAAGVVTVFGLVGLSETVCAFEVAASEAAEALSAPEAGIAEVEVEVEVEAETADAANAPDAAADAVAPEPARGALAAFAAEAAAAAATSDAVITCSIEPSTTTREPSMPAPLWATFSVSVDVSASLLRINCSHAPEFL